MDSGGGSAGSAGMPEKAEWLARFVAEVIDWIVWTIALMPLLLGVAIGFGLVRDSWLVVGLFSLVGLLMTLAILTLVSLTYRNGRSVGKRVTGTQVIRVDDSPVSWAYNFWLRTFLFKGIIIGTVGGMTLELLFLANYLWPLWDRDAQALHDKMVGTRVVKVPPQSQPSARFRT
ncbi:MAG: RDD family protein [Chloroflexi bacterium]|nr:RDD family protein [Chloroflexota bacterium]MYK34808.1 RDD family protein [Chloroflexota bacterium]